MMDVESLHHLPLTNARDFGCNDDLTRLEACWNDAVRIVSVAYGCAWFADARRALRYLDPTQSSSWNRYVRLAKLGRDKRKHLVHDGLGPRRFRPGEQEALQPKGPSGKLDALPPGRRPLKQGAVRTLATEASRLPKKVPPWRVSIRKTRASSSKRRGTIEEMVMSYNSSKSSRSCHLKSYRFAI